MATRLVVPQQNRVGDTAKVDGSRAKQKPAGLSVRKALANITNSEKPSSHQEPSSRKALANITNSEKPSCQQGPKKYQPKKPAAAASTKNIANKGDPLGIEEERCLHNHQNCINSQAKANPQHVLKSILEFDEAPLEIWSPSTPSTLKQKEVDFLNTPVYLDFTLSPVSLKVQSSVRRSMLWSPFPTMD